MCAATAEVARQGVADQGLIGIGVLLQQAGDTHQDATAAIAALRRLFVDERLQHQTTDGVFWQTLRCLDLPSLSRPNGQAAGVLGLAIHQDSASPAVFGATAKPHRGIGALVTQYMQQKCLGRGVWRDAVVVVLKGGHSSGFIARHSRFAVLEPPGRQLGAVAVTQAIG